MTDKVKRTMLTPEQRVAKLEAQLEAAKVKAAAKENKVINDLLDKRSAVDKKVSALLSERSAIDAKLTELGHDVDVTISTDVDQGTFV